MARTAAGQAGGDDAARAHAAGLAGARSLWTEREFTQALLEGMSDAVVACDAEGLLVLFNRVAREWHGADLMRLPPEEWPRRYDLYREDGLTPLPVAEVPLARALRGEAVVDAAMAIAVRGRPVRYVLANGSPIDDASGRRLGAFVVMRDVTALRRADGELRAAKATLEARVEERTAQLELQVATLRGILDSASAPIFSVDRQYRYTSFNRPYAEAVTALYGATVEVGGSLLACTTAADDRPLARESVDRALAGEAFVQDAYLGPEGARRYLRVALGPIRNGAGEVIGAAAFATDLTDRRRAEEELRESEARYRRNDAINAARLHLIQLAATHSLDDLLEETLNSAEALTGSFIGFFHVVDEDQRTLTLQAWSTRTKASFCQTAGGERHYAIADAGVWVDCVHQRAPVVHNDYASLAHKKGLPPGHAHLVRELVVPVMRGSRITAILGVGNKAADYGPADVEAVSLLADLAWEISDRKRAEESLRRLNRQLRALSECNEALMRATDEASILDEVCQIVCDRIGYRMAWVAYVEHDAAKTLRPVAVAGEDAGFVSSARATWSEHDPRGRGPGGTAVRTGRTIAVQDLAATPEFAPWLEEARARGYRASIYLPLRDEEGQVFGLLLIYSSDRGAFSAGEIRLLEELAGDLAFGVNVLRGRARRKEAERSIALLSFALNNVREAAFLADDRGRLRYVNDEACRRLGFTREELLLRSVPDLDPDLPAEAWPAHWNELTARRSLRFESHHRARDGRVFPVEVSANYFEYEGKGYNLALAHDVSERRKLEEQLRQSQKMEAVGTLAGGVAHDFNNILTGIIGYGNLLLESLEEASPHRESIEAILEASRRAAQLTHGLLAFSRKQVLNPKPVDLNEIVRGVERLLRRVIGEDVELSTALAPEPLVVMADAGQLEQVLMNLATNARDAMPGGGILSIATKALVVDEASAAAHVGRRTGPAAQLSVSDTGVGMDAGIRQKIFEPFFTTKEHGKGTGLGLSIVYGIVSQHGGAIDVYSEPGRGTSFKIVLPRASAPPVEAATARGPAPIAGGTETILVAEDDPIVRGMIATVLRGRGYRVLEAVDGDDGLARWAAHRAEIDLLVLDVVMPRKSGREVFDAIAAESPGVPALFLSGYTADIIHKKGIFDEGLEFLPKPLSPNDLLARVREILDRRPGRRAGPD